MEKYLPDVVPKSSSQECNIPPEAEVQDEAPLEEEKVSEYTTEEDEEGLASCRSYLEEEMFHSCNSKMEEEDEEEEPPRTAMKKTIKTPLKLVQSLLTFTSSQKLQKKKTIKKDQKRKTRIHFSMVGHEKKETMEVELKDSILLSVAKQPGTNERYVKDKLMIKYHSRMLDPHMTM